MPSPFHFYPVSIAQTCAPGQPQGAANIDGLGVPPFGYSLPPFFEGHQGTDFYVSEDAIAYSIGENGLVVGIGAGNYNEITGDSDPIQGSLTAYDWGSAVVEGKRGYSVIVRYGHLYVLYGHLQSLEPTIFVGATLNGGDKIGRVGKFNDPHLHIEVRNFTSPILLNSLQTAELRNFGFTAFATEGVERAQHHYDLMQLFGLTVIAWANDENIVTNQVSLTIDVSELEADPNETTRLIRPLTIGTCIRTFRVYSEMATVYDPVLAIEVRGLVQVEANQALLIAPSIVPIR